MLYDGAVLLLRHDQVDFCDFNMTLYMNFVFFIHIALYVSAIIANKWSRSSNPVG